MAFYLEEKMFSACCCDRGGDKTEASVSATSTHHCCHGNRDADPSDLTLLCNRLLFVTRLRLLTALVVAIVRDIL